MTMNQHSFDRVPRDVSEVLEIVRAIKDELHERKGQGEASDEVMLIEGACAMLGIARSTMYDYTSKRLVPFYRRGKRLLFLRSELVEYIKNGRKPIVK